MNTWTSWMAAYLASATLALAAPPASAAGGEEIHRDRERASIEWARYKTAWNQHDAAAVASAFTADASFVLPSLPEPARGPGAIADAVASTLRAFPDLELTVVANDWVDERRMVERWTLTGTWTQRFLSGPLTGVAPTGRRFSIAGASFYEWEDGKIKRYEAYYDRMALLAQIGALPQPASVAQTR